MLINYSISGGVYINGTPVQVVYTVSNLNTGFISDEYSTELGYYNINLANFPGNTFDKDNIIMFDLHTRYNGTYYKTQIYDIIDHNKDTNSIDANLIANWDYISNILITGDKYTRTINFITTTYQQILFKLYIYYNGDYKEIDSALINKQIVDLTFTHNGKFKIMGYVVKDNVLLTYSEKIFEIKYIEPNEVITNQIRYIEWE